MARTRVLCVVGTRPDAIKVAPVIRALRRERAFQTQVLATAQHRTLLDQVLAVFAIRADHDLDIMRADQDLFDVTVRGLSRVERVLDRLRPDLVLVQGDTTSSFVCALAAYYRRTPVAHIEAGLRTGDIHNPYPEEANRRFIDAISDFPFPPTRRAREFLLREGVAPDRAFVTGNTVVDALTLVARLTPPAPVPVGIRRILVTTHRRESFGVPLERICRALRAVARQPDVELVFPVHPNPHVQRVVRPRLGGLPNIHLLPPLDYFRFVALLRSCHFVITDSGGVQEEAPTFHKPVLVVRERTERPEGIAAGCARLVGTDPARIVGAARQLLTSPRAYQRMARVRNPYGDGRAALRIRAFLAYAFGRRRTRPRPFVSPVR